MDVKKEKIKGGVILRCHGSLDGGSGTPKVEKAINESLEGEDVSHMLLDFSEVDYISSTGMRLLLQATKKLSKRSGKLSIFSVKTEVMDIILLAGFQKLLHLYDDEGEALGDVG